MMIIQKRYISWPFDFKKVCLQIVLLMGILFIFSENFPLIKSLRLSCVLSHELGHAYAAQISGGKVLDVNLESNEGGICKTREGAGLFIFFMGYLMCSIVGSFLLLASQRKHNSEILCIALGLLSLFAVLAWKMDPLAEKQAWVICISSFVLAVLVNYTWILGLILLRAIGIFLCLYGISDIFSDLIFGNVQSHINDAYKFSKLTNIHPQLIVIFWLIICTCISFFSFLWSMRIIPQKIKVMGTETVRIV